MKYILFFLIIFSYTSVEAATRRNRTLKNPQAVIPNAILANNNQGGHNYYVRGKLVGQSVKNFDGTYNIYIKGRLKYKSAKFLLNYFPSRAIISGNNIIYRSYRNYSKNKEYYGSPLQIRGQKRTEYLKKWSKEQAKEIGGVKFWKIR